MKRIASLVGVSAMVLSLGLGSAFAQSQTTPGTTPPQTKQAAPAELGKDQPVKPGDAVKADKTNVDKAAPTVKAKKPGHTMKKTVHRRIMKHHPAHVKSVKSSGNVDQKGVKAEEPKPAAKQ